ncbi:MAG: MTAP family purine nucleoside phosphorylase [bacterium]|nr:MTAP family purine nucleoside phosphorylase [bacterium]
MNIGIITGSGFYDFPELSEASSKEISTKFGSVNITESARNGNNLFFIARHASGHKNLPNMINYRANILAMKENNVDLIIATSIMGILDASIPMAKLCLFDDLYFLDNRLPSGEVCTIYTDPGDSTRGHYLFGSPFSMAGGKTARAAAEKQGISYEQNLVYAHAGGPRFNTRTEIGVFQKAGCSMVSQTAGPEIILAGECEMGYVLLGFGVDYANGVKDTPTPIEILNENMAASKGLFSKMILGIIDEIDPEQKGFFDNGFVYRFD